MLSRIASVLVPAFGRLTVTTDSAADFAEGSIIAANHTSLADPAVVLAALRRLGVEPAVLAAAGLWRIPLLGRALAREGYIPVYRRDARAGDALDGAAEALAQGRLVLIYGEGGIPLRKDAGEAAPEAFRSGLARLVHRTGAPVIPLGQAGSRRIASGSWTKQVAGVGTALLRRPGLHVHVGAPIMLAGDLPTRTVHARAAVTDAWRQAAERLGEPIALAAWEVRQQVGQDPTAWQQPADSDYEVGCRP